jgi:hypothetical protein
MIPGADRRVSAGSGRWIARLLLVLFALRAAIPAGYMPDADALRDGRFEVVVCTPTGLKTILVSFDEGGGAPSDNGSQDAQTADECPFQTVVAKALIAPEAIGAALPRRARPPVHADGADHAGPSTVPGPPLGPRAPPHAVS